VSTLKEKFYNEIKYMERAEICEKIADDYAINFANWLLTEPFDVSFEGKNIKELLEIFKKEKGL
jgi:hypothetical protein